MSSTKEYRIFCFIPGEQDDFPVKIEKSGLVDELKEKIKEKRQQKLADVDAATLNLYQVTVNGSPDRKRFIDQLNQLSQNLNENMVGLRGCEQLSEYFGQSPPKKYYIIVQIPEGELAGESIKATVCGALAETVLTHPIYPPLIVYHSLQSLPYRPTSMSAVDLTQPSESTEHGRANRTRLRRPVLSTTASKCFYHPSRRPSRITWTATPDSLFGIHPRPHPVLLSIFVV